MTVFGTSPPYLRLCQTAGYSPSASRPLRAALRSCPPATILHDEQFEWLPENVGDVPVQSISGGTDIVGCFVLGNPNLPVYAGEAQCRSLGLDVRAWAPAVMTVWASSCVPSHSRPVRSASTAIPPATGSTRPTSLRTPACGRTET